MDPGSWSTSGHGQPSHRIGVEGTGVAGGDTELAVTGDVVEIGPQTIPRCEERSARRGPRRADRDGPGPSGQSPRPRAARGDQGLSATRQAVLVSRTKAINELKSLIVVAPEQLRSLPARPFAGQPARIHRTHGRSPRAPRSSTGHRTDAAVDHRAHPVPDRKLADSIQSWSASSRPPAGPALLAEPGVGPVVAAQLLDQLVPPRTGPKRSSLRRRSPESRPLEASSGQRTRHRLNRGGDRALNRACTRWRSPASDATPKPGPTRPGAPLQGKTHRDIRRCLKRSPRQDSTA